MWYVNYTTRWCGRRVVVCVCQCMERQWCNAWGMQVLRDNGTHVWLLENVLTGPKSQAFFFSFYGRLTRTCPATKAYRHVYVAQAGSKVGRPEVEAGKYAYEMSSEGPMACEIADASAWQPAEGHDTWHGIV